MSELIPVAQAESLRASLLEYLGTTFSLAEPSTRANLEDFLRSDESGIFRGPYVRLRLPFRQAEPGWRSRLEWYEGFPPYGHQAAAFGRLSSLGEDGSLRRPQPTLVTTGTGSGKTESFLYPILDHVLRAQRAGLTGTKAIILYPMNALANDQAKRLTELLVGQPALRGVTAGLYTGQRDALRPRVTAAGLITDREAIRSSPPDILLTNYKMLDQLLLREADAKIWAKSAHSLQYLVLDEFHTYDGAQGTDVAMLIRRLGLALKSHWPADETARVESGLQPDDLARPLGIVTPVATSATLGDKGDPARMLDFARTVFGEEFPPESVVTESRLPLDEWIDTRASSAADRRWTAVELDAFVGQRIADALGGWNDEDGIVGLTTLPPDVVTGRVLANLHHIGDVGQTPPQLSDLTHDDLLELAKGHPVVKRLVELTEDAVETAELASEVFGASSAAGWNATRAEQVLTAVLTALSHLRKECGRTALSVDVHLWTRELTRLNRSATADARFHWGDDGVLVNEEPDSKVFPALYCRHCGRSGWGVVLAPTGSDLDTDDGDIRGRHLRRDERFRPLIYAPADGDRALADPGGVPIENLTWWHVGQRMLTMKPVRGEGEDQALPVLTHPLGDAGGKPSVSDTCPSCGQDDGIRFLGSAIATMLSVTLSGLFGTPGLDTAEKKALVFTDSVQDAAHRAGFVQSRSHALTVRSVLRQAMDSDPVDLDTLVKRILDNAGDNKNKRYRLLPPELAERDAFADFWSKDTVRQVKQSVRTRVRHRLAHDVLLEHGLRSSVGRTLEATGAAVAEVSVGRPLLLQSARGALDAIGQDTLEGFETVDDDLVGWARGFVEHMRTRGAISHKWFDRFRREDGNRWSIWGGRPRSDGMPGYGPGNSAPAYPRIGGTHDPKSDLEPVASDRGWYASWTAKCLKVDKRVGATMARALMEQLAQRDLVEQAKTNSGGTTFALRPDSVVVRTADLDRLSDGWLALVCSTCGDTVHGTDAVIEQLEDGPCRVFRCDGVVARTPVRDNFYRRMYSGADPARVVAREHTGMLEDKVRLAYEVAFKAKNPEPNAPNVLVATPTLELGIDIGDLSAVMLSSLPKSVASYLQRVGRAGRLTGNSLALAFVTGRGDQLPRFQKPLSTINGAVTAPATYLNAEEILRRQYLASVADELARRKDAPHPRTARDALGSAEPDTYLGVLLAAAEAGPDNSGRLDRFLAGFPDITSVVAERLRDWASPTGGGEPGSSPLAARCYDASRSWQTRLETLKRRKSEIETAINTDLAGRAASPAATKDDERALRSARAALNLTGFQMGQLQGEHWVGTLEEFGLLPNYTLLDDTVTLEVAVSWVDPETDEWVNESMELARGSAQALRDFAPGATFYSRGYAIEIDAIDLGSGRDAVREWACCQQCGFTTDVTDAGAPGGVPAPSSCPRCGDNAIADVGQRIEVIELKRVTSVIRREEATIDDKSDERHRTAFTIWALADVDLDRIDRQWFVDDYGFGARYQRDMTIRWLNLGKRSANGTTIALGGMMEDVPLFRVCEECGKLDSSTTANLASEHRPWCSLRRATQERTKSVALARSLTTEGLVLRLPKSVTMGDDFSLPSLSSALLLALRLRIGGAPDHLAVTEIVDPSPVAGSPSDALLLHDVVPGGTGYLAELANPHEVWTMLNAAWKLLEACPCQGEGKLACDQCLLPHTPPWQVERASRASAARHLKSILLGRSDVGPDDIVPDTSPWSVSEEEGPGLVELESHIELKFREVLRERLTQIGATVTEKPGPQGNEWAITLAGGAVWRLEPQVLVPDASTRPDFMLRSADPSVPRTVIYTDGWKYHASPSHNRLADDAHKRENLRLLGYNVLAFTWEDLTDEGSHGDRDVPWFMPGFVANVLTMAGDKLSRAHIGLVQRPAIEALVEWIQNPDDEGRGRLASWLPTLLFPKVALGKLVDETSLAELALASLDGTAPDPGTKDGGFWTTRGLSVGIRETTPGALEISVVLDDSEEMLGDENRSDWREWLHLANLLNFATIPVAVTTRSALVGAVPVEPTVVVGQERPGAVEAALEGAWGAALAAALDGERQLVLGLAEAGDIPAPELGEEHGDGVPLSLAWPDHKIAVEFDGLATEDRRVLEADGWVFYPAVITVVHDAVLAATNAGRTL